jgi:hypothetical protein
MKLGKEEIQKIVLGVLLFFGVIYSYFDLLLGPLVKHQEVATRSVQTLIPGIANAKSQIEKAKLAEKDAPKATMPMRQVQAMIPEGSPVAWFPTKIADFFKKRGIDRVSTRISGETVDKELPRFRKLSWGVDIPKVDFITFAQAMAALENEEPLIEISALQIDASRDDVETQHVFITVNNLVNKQ